MEMDIEASDIAKYMDQIIKVHIISGWYYFFVRLNYELFNVIEQF